jgi:germination protein M
LQQERANDRSREEASMANLIQQQRTAGPAPGVCRLGTTGAGLRCRLSGLALALTLLTSPGAAQAAAPPTSAAPPLPVAVTFTRGDHLVREARLVPAGDPARASVLALLAGPAEPGDATEVPAGTRLLGLALRDGTATIDLSPDLQQAEGDPAIPLLLAQLVDTLTQFPTVQRVALEVAGRPLTTLGGDGLVVPPVLDRETSDGLLAPSVGGTP